MADIDLEKLAAEAIITGIIFGNSNPDRKMLERIKKEKYDVFSTLKNFIIKYLESNKSSQLPLFITDNFDIFGISNEKNISNTPKN